MCNFVRILLLLFCVWYISVSGSQVSVLILARGGSKGVRLKNLQKVGGVSLICRAIATAKNAGVKEISVSTDHPYIALEALRCNATIFHRSHVTASDSAPSIWGVQEYLEKNPKLKLLFLLQATSPFIKVSHIRSAIEKINTPFAFDCVFTVTRNFKLRWQYRDGKIYPLNFNPTNRPRRQDWSGELLETGAFYLTRAEVLMKGLLQNKNCTFVEVSATESLEIDSYHDLEVANALINANLI